MPYLHQRPEKPTIHSKGYLGYAFGPLGLDLEVHHIDVEKGHDTFQVSKKITRIYYVISGSGYFTIDGRRYDVVPGMVVEVPPRVEYSYSGRMQLVAFSTPRWFRGNDATTRWNPDVIDEPYTPSHDKLLHRIGRMRIFGKSPARAFLRVNESLWKALPRGVTSLGPARAYGTWLHKTARAQRTREQALATFFLRNRPQLELMRRLVDRKAKGERLNVAVLACSGGAEAYSVAWTLKSARPDLDFTLHAIDIAPEAVELGRKGMYSSRPSEVTRTAVLERMTAAEIE
ncbi:MAG TPA: CheR family methyltransferase, partial [Terriglobales bacterium]|nr:CheR family methyltransferase [Terriglobales bacterium]